MDKLKQVLESKIRSFSEKIPAQGSKSANGKQKRLQFLIENNQGFQEEINQIIAEFSKLNSLEKDELIEIKNFVSGCFKSILQRI